MIGFNGGLIGRTRDTSGEQSVPGVWTANEQVIAKRALRWPGGLTSLLLHGDGANGSTTFTDNSSYGLSVTPQGNAQISTAQSKFGGSSILLDGNGDYLTVANNNVFDYGTGDFTIEMWIRPVSLSNQPFLYSKNNAGSGWFLQLDASAQIYFGPTTSNYGFWTSTGITTNNWHSLAVTRVGTTLYAFVNGTLLSTKTVSATNVDNTSDLVIGSRRPTTTGNDFNGYIDELRITKGLARYTASYTPQTVAFPNE